MLAQLKTNTISLKKSLKFGADQGLRDFKAFAQKEGGQFINTNQANTQGNGYLITDKSWRLGLGVIAGFSVLACCFVSQLIAAQAKKSKLRLNKYYSKKKYEKD